MDFKKLYNTLNEALDNYMDQHQWEALIQDIEENYECGLHTENHLELAKFFKYEDLVTIFEECIKYRNENNGYTLGDRVGEKEYEAFQDLFQRMKNEIPNKEDFELIRSFL